MSLILKGIDLAEMGERRRIVIYDNGDVVVKEERWDEDGYKHYKTFYDVKAIQIPKNHGRLIDADELKEKRETMCWKDEYYMTHESDFIDSRHIDNAPTILEVEE